MLNPVVALGNAKKYTEDTIKGEGAIKGKDGRDGDSAYQLAVKKGYSGTETEWLESLKGTDGVDGKSAYELAVEKGYSGTEEDWIASLKGEVGETGETGPQGDKGTGIESIVKQSTAGLKDTYVITYSDGSQTTFDVINGANIEKTSQLVNDSDFITSTTINLVNYYLKDEVYNKAKIDELLRNVGAGLSVKIVPSLPTEEISGTTIYLINTTGSQYNQYMYIDGDWASLGSTSVDLSSYYNKTQIDTMLLGYVNASTLLTQLMAYTKTADLAKVALSNDYNDLDNLPEIPDVSGIKPYSENLQDSNNTAPTSKVVYDAVQTINGELAKKLEESDLEPYAKTEDIPTDYITEADLEPYAKSEDVPEVDDADTTSTDKVWSAKKISDSLVDLDTKVDDKADKTDLANYVGKSNGGMSGTTYGGDLNDLTEVGMYSVATKINTPPTGDTLYGTLTVTKGMYGSFIAQTVVATSNRVFARQKNGDTWSAWQELATMDKVGIKTMQITRLADASGNVILFPESTGVPINIMFNDAQNPIVTWYFGQYEKTWYAVIPKMADQTAKFTLYYI